MFQKKKSCIENQNTHFVFNNFFYFFENCAICEIMWENVVERSRPHLTRWRMRNACRISQATNTHSEVIMLLFHCYNDCTNMPQWYVIRALFVLYTYLYMNSKYTYTSDWPRPLPSAHISVLSMRLDPSNTGRHNQRRYKNSKLTSAWPKQY